MAREEMYFCLKLTSDEHYIVKYELEKECNKLGLKLKYYRELKDGHVPTYREVKIVGKNVNRIKEYLTSQYLDDNMATNPYKEENSVSGI